MVNNEGLLLQKARGVTFSSAINPRNSEHKGRLPVPVFSDEFTFVEKEIDNMFKPSNSRSKFGIEILTHLVNKYGGEFSFESRVVNGSYGNIMQVAPSFADPEKLETIRNIYHSNLSSGTVVTFRTDLIRMKLDNLIE